MIREAIHEVVERHDLSTETARQIMLEMIRGEATQSQIASFVTAMRMKGETEQELKGFVMAMRELATVIAAPKGTVDLCGTGGDGFNSFNISTAASFVAAGAGVPVAKHGNRSVSSRCGSADVLSALGLPIDLEQKEVEKCLATTGMGFLFAPKFHSSMKNVLGPRREIGVRTFFNILGPMTNPANVKHQLIGVYDYALSHKMANVLSSLGTSHALIVNGGGMDEITNLGETQVLDMQDGGTTRYALSPGDFGLDLAEPEDLKGGDPTQNARILLSVLKGEESPRSDIVALNAAAAIYVAGKAADLHEGFDLAMKSLLSGAAYSKLRDFSEVACGIEEARQSTLDIQALRLRRAFPKTLISRSSEIVSHIASQLSETDRGRKSMESLDPELLARPSVLSVIVLDRIHSLLASSSQDAKTVVRENLSMSSAIESFPGVAIIAEYKPTSPSSPPLSIPPDPETVARIYSSSGLSGVSVLVEPNYFSGSPELFSFFRERLKVPMLFKDFVVTEAQIASASALGADSVLLVAKALKPETLDRLVDASVKSGLEPLVEVHDEQDVAKLSLLRSVDSVKMIGVNCRDLRTMKTDLSVLARLRPLLPQDKLVVAESGVRSIHDLEKTSSADAVLIGSMFMDSKDLVSQLGEVVAAAGRFAR